MFINIKITEKKKKKKEKKSSLKDSYNVLHSFFLNIIFLFLNIIFRLSIQSDRFEQTV